MIEAEAKALESIRASIFWLTGLYFLHTIGELCLSPIGLSMVNKLTPARFTSLMMGVWFLAIATGNKLAGTMSSLYPEQQTIVADFDASNLQVNGKTVDWTSIVNNPKVDANNIWKLNLVKKNAESKEPDSLVSLTIEPIASPVIYDSIKVKRIIPAKYSEEKLKKIAKWGDKEPKYLFGISDEPNTCYLLQNNLFAKNNKIVIEKWNTNVKPPVFLGIVIKDLYTYFMLFVGLSGIAAFILFFLSRRLRKMMHGVV